MKISVLFLAATICLLLLQANNSIGQQQLIKKPIKYLLPIDNPEPPYKNDQFSEYPWFVWSDQSNNAVYSAPEGSDQISSLGFGEKFGVLDIAGKRLLLAKAEDIQNNYPLAEEFSLPPGKKSLGWVDAEKLLLWSRCLQTEECRADKKAIIINVSDANNPEEAAQNIKFYKAPGTNYEPASEAERGILKFYFVYKETEKFLLLGKTSGSHQIGLSNTIAGWINKKYCVQWNTNVALEINWHPNAVAQREASDNPVMAWENRNDAGSFNRDGQIIFKESPIYKQRTVGFTNHFLLLEQDWNNINAANNLPIKVGVIGEAGTRDSSEINLAQLIPEDLIQSYQEGYTLMRPSPDELPWFQPVLLVERGELDQIHNSFRDLMVVQNYPSAVQRSRLVDAMEEMMKICLNNQVVVHIRDTRLDDFNYCSACFPLSSMFNDLSLYDFSTRKVSSTQIHEMIGEFSKTSEMLNEIIRNDRAYPKVIFPGSDEVYYWIPVDIFPHNPKEDDVSLDKLFLK